MCYWLRQRYLVIRLMVVSFLACLFGQYVEVNTPTLQYRAYIWRGTFYFIK